MTLTATQAAALKFIRDFYGAFRSRYAWSPIVSRSPYLREIMVHLRLPNQEAARSILIGLAKQGYLNRPFKRRGQMIITMGGIAELAKFEARTRQGSTISPVSPPRAQKRKIVDPGAILAASLARKKSLQEPTFKPLTPPPVMVAVKQTGGKNV